jgi:formylglycine-generating enzyme required for sulfatase activity/tRNA A-37 threonylcarbamoyl transferase component Bud32
MDNKPEGIPDPVREDDQKTLIDLAGAAAVADQPTTLEQPPAPNASRVLAVGQQIGRYRIEAFLGRGGMGEVYTVCHPVLRQRFAMKFLVPEITGDTAALQRFEREAMVMAGLKHPGIVLVDDYGEWQGRVWLRMELVRGVPTPPPAARRPALPDDDQATRLAKPGRAVSLAQYLAARRGPMPAGEVVSLLTGILEALGFAHRNGVIHRDLKPANILLTEAGEPKIADFGLVRLAGLEWLRSRYETVVARSRLDEGSTVMLADAPAGAIMGTWEYMSPEQRAGEQVDPTSDLYTMGLIAYRLLTGESLSGLVLPSQVIPGLSAGWDEWMLKALRRNPRERFADAGAMLAALPAAGMARLPLGQGGTPAAIRAAAAAPPSSPLDTASQPRPVHRRGFPWWRAAVVSCLAAVIGAAFVMRDQFRFAQRAPQEGSPWHAAALPMEMRWIPPGSFTMGETRAPADLYPNEQPATRVTFPQGFWIGTTEVTQAQWLALMAENPSRQSGDPALPVENVSWQEAVAFAALLTASEHRAGKLSAGWIYRLPTEAEWEYACRAGGEVDPDQIDRLAWHRGNSEGRTRLVALQQPNDFGLYDMLGNVLEWCGDAYYPELPGGNVRAPFRTGPDNGRKVVRGGAWITGLRSLRPSWRDAMAADEKNDFTGFRLVLVRPGDD